MSEVTAVDQECDHIGLTILNGETGEKVREEFDGVVLATGFRNIGTDFEDIKIPDVLKGLISNFELGNDGCVEVSRNYISKMKPDYASAGGLVLNGLCENSHGMGDAGSVSLLSLRAKEIVDALIAMDKAEADTAKGLPNWQTSSGNDRRSSLNAL